jgi:hypothetical protein
MAETNIPDAPNDIPLPGQRAGSHEAREKCEKIIDILHRHHSGKLK